ncbi:MAG: RNA polymerase sigma-54 factor [Rhodobiaceae bacterium]|nr:RNA polymerase sigma-54 factor [Rhodobiaceae bacterium]RZO34204.1 MAG: RNA polymerase sigma-54 factor [Hyphomicrobiales bacterium]|tara:strand:- start:2237 stop:3559 length:1323 start_codon:yes stop_codon:yes gene_type:complete
MSLGLTNIATINQAQTLSPQVQLTIKLLSLNNIELESYLEKKIEDNPLLIDRQNTKEHELRIQKYSDKYSRNSSNLDLLNNIGYAKSLREHLLDQLLISSMSNKEKIIATYLINILDEAGYLTENDETICLKLGVNNDAYEEVLVSLQSFEPTGVFSRTLSECLYLQLSEKNLINDELLELLKNIELIAEDNFRELSARLNIGKDDLFRLINIIRKCNPKPGLNYSRDTLEIIAPDIIIEKNLSGVYAIKLVQNYFSNITVDQTYNDVILESKKKKDEFITNHYRDAKMLISSIAQRQRTLLKIAHEVMLQQRDFLENGINHMHPLNLDKISKITNLHISTVSRSIQNKYIETPRGTFEMKYFFDKGTYGEEQNNQISSKTIENRIKELIKNETSSNILSDDKIVNLLKKYDINIARRTVAKYRTKLNILPSSKRKNRFL